MVGSLRLVLCWNIFLASEPLYIRDDQKRTNEVWHEHKSGVDGSRWFPVKNLEIRDMNHVKKSGPNKEPIESVPEPNVDKKNERSDGCSDGSSDVTSNSSSDKVIKYATPRCLRKVRR